jgi:hypothetical protein
MVRLMMRSMTQPQLTCQVYGRFRSPMAVAVRTPAVEPDLSDRQDDGTARTGLDAELPQDRR